MVHILATADDAELMAAVRRGEHEVFGLLYSRHEGSAARYARRLMRSSDDANDVVAEAFARLLGILQRGLGPTDEFRPYLMRTVRNVAYDHGRTSRKLEFTDEMSVLEGVVPFHDAVVEGVERDLVIRAFKALPPRWQQVLWLTCIEDRTVENACAVLGINTNALSSLAYRAREGLRQAYLQANLPAGTSSLCSPYTAKLGPLVRGALGHKPRELVEAHLRGCLTCTRAVQDLREVNSTLREHLAENTRELMPAALRAKARSTYQLDQGKCA